ncbi:MAG: hypothetical protein KBT03_13460 [Bacteroidales bacterium]|nr:hypothetical protein [Candidatus Scybalousia scybalohippi]
MLQNSNNSSSFNNFEYLDEVPYRVFEYLLTNTSEQAENFWKCIKYADKDCLSKPNLTIKEKKDLIWTGQQNQEDYSLFNKPLVGDSVFTANQMVQIRLYEYQTVPTTRLDALILYELDIYTNERANGLYNDRGIWVERTTFLKNSCLLPLLNGVDLGIGYNFLSFDREKSRGSQAIMNIGNSKSFYGISMLLALQYSNVDVGGTCG